MAFYKRSGSFLSTFLNEVLTPLCVCELVCICIYIYTFICRHLALGSQIQISSSKPSAPAMRLKLTFTLCSFFSHGYRAIEQLILEGTF